MEDHLVMSPDGGGPLLPQGTSPPVTPKCIPNIVAYQPHLVNVARVMVVDSYCDWTPSSTPTFLPWFLGHPHVLWGCTQVALEFTLPNGCLSELFKVYYVECQPFGVLS